MWGDPALRGLSLGSAPLVLALPWSQREGAEEPQIEVGCALGPVFVLLSLCSLGQLESAPPVLPSLRPVPPALC